MFGVLRQVVVVCGSYLSEKTYGEKEANLWLIFERKNILRNRDKFSIKKKKRQISFLRVSINILLCNPNLNVVNILFPCSHGCRQLAELC